MNGQACTQVRYCERNRVIRQDHFWIANRICYLADDAHKAWLYAPYPGVALLRYCARALKLPPG